MTEQIVEKGFGTLENSRNEMIKIFENPEDMKVLTEYFEHNKRLINGVECYSCNGNDCDCRFGRAFAMLKYIAQPERYRGLISDSNETQLESIQNAYFYTYNLPVDELDFIQNQDGSSKVILNGELYGVSKFERVKEIGLEDFIEVSIPA